jgi:mannan endo-1,4-beta-mannosidase
MKKFLKPILLILLVSSTFVLTAQSLIDQRATEGTKALYANLAVIRTQGFLFGHQDDDAYGVTWKGEKSRSDVKDVCGSYPAVHGWDVGKSLSSPNNIDGVPFTDMLYWIEQTYNRGGINTVSWHWDNPVTNGDAWDKTSAVKDILPGGSKHSVLVTHLDLLADFFNKCKSGSVFIPIIFRPWHEHNGNWFWWGKGNCKEEEYIKLWKFTVDYLKNTKNIHHLIYAFSPDRSRIESLNSKDYLYGYPGDDYVDIIGLDNYMDVGVKWNKKSPDAQRADFVKSLTLVSQIAAEKKKIPALTETGLEGVSNPNWFTDVILNPIKENKDIQIAYLLVWRNGNPNHHYAPYKGHASETNFKKFFSDPKTIFESDLKDMYK